MEHKRLIAFGCSHTYGEALPDCWDKDKNMHGKEPSKLSWPYVLQQNTKFTEVINLGWPGASNKRIAKKILDFEFEEGDTAIILWTRTARHTIYKNKDQYIHMVPQMIEGGMSSGFFTNIDLEKKDFENRVKTFYEDYYEDYDFQFEQIIRMNYVHSYMKSKKVKSYHLIVKSEIDMNDWTHLCLPDLKCKDFHWRPYFYIDSGLDGMHPGVSSHKNFALNIKKWFFTGKRVFGKK